MSERTADTCNAHMRTYRDHLRRLNDRRAEGYIRQNGQHVVVAIQELAQAAPVTLAIRQLHEAIRSSPARNFWPVIRQTKGVLFAICATDYRDICFFRRGRRMFVAGCGTVRSSFSA